MLHIRLKTLHAPGPAPYRAHMPRPTTDGLQRLQRLLRGKTLRVIVDPGHGQQAGALPADPGAVHPDGTTEALQVSEFAGTLQWVLQQVPGLTVTVSRGAARPSWLARTFGLGRADVAVSLHMDTANGTGGSMAYYPARADYPAGPIPARSAAWARCLMDCTPDPEFKVLPDTASRYQRLYIRGFLAPSVALWELDPVHAMNREERLARAAQFVDALCLALQSGAVTARPA